MATKVGKEKYVGQSKDIDRLRDMRVKLLNEPNPIGRNHQYLLDR